MVIVKPPSLIDFGEGRRGEDSAPAMWYQQVTGEKWTVDESHDLEALWSDARQHSVRLPIRGLASCEPLREPGLVARVAKMAA